MGRRQVQYIRPEFGVASIVIWVALGLFGMVIAASELPPSAGNLYFALTSLVYAAWFLLAAFHPRIGRLVVVETAPTGTVQQLCLPAGVVFLLFALHAGWQAFAPWVS
jgi:hypothetical protein